MLNKLYHLLIAPVSHLLPPPGGYLTIVPYGPLHALPFHALYDGSRFLVEDYQLNYLPASSLLIQLQTRKALHQQTTNPSKKPALILGYADQGRLQYVHDEAMTIATMLGGRCELEQAATISLLMAEAPDTPIIHIATHGHNRQDAPDFSSLLLADGQFNALDAFNLDLKACELVTLSGCETGLSLSSGGDEQLGLGRAFLAAGARALLISLWSVEDDATNQLMRNFYQQLLAGVNKIQALRTAQCMFLRQETSSRSHPYYWAAFRLVGEPGPLLPQQQTQEAEIYDKTLDPTY